MSWAAYQAFATVTGLSMTSVLFLWDTISGWAGQTPDGVRPGHIPEDWGIPWSFTAQTGMENVNYVNDSSGETFDPLLGSGGPWPDIHLFNTRGEHIGKENLPRGYFTEGATQSRLIFPHSQSQPIHDITWVVLKQKEGDPICIVDFSIIHMSESGKAKGAVSFGSVTAQTCGLPWYWSNVYRQGSGNYHSQIPCFWLGKSGYNILQLHMPTHSLRRPAIESTTHKDLWEHYCNKPIVLSWRDVLPNGAEDYVLEQDWNKKGHRDYEKDFERLYKDGHTSTRYAGEIYDKPRYGDDKKKHRVRRSTSAGLLSYGEGLTVEHTAIEKSAKMLCNSKTAVGPDYVNVPEGYFCRMADRTLFPLCDFNDGEGLHEDCFDMESQDLALKGRKLLKRSQYAFVRHRGRQ
ncbi:hypothetical protein VM1G_10793 [Cytospora mali]|uniref:Uncharacterized protein n=1 Tax=Cytospora mali TaxID=578113 RepID=A0A194VJ50_CYTMA|nr:hypothetical protein VM1G_10793 [Valsa mali]